MEGWAVDGDGNGVVGEIGVLGYDCRSGVRRERVVWDPAAGVDCGRSVGGVDLWRSDWGALVVSTDQTGLD